MVCIVVIYTEIGGGIASTSSARDQSDVAIVAIVIAVISLLTSIATFVIMIMICVVFLGKGRHGGYSNSVGGAAEARNEMEMKQNVCYVTTTERDAMEMKQNVSYATTTEHTSTPQDATYETMT